MDKSQLISNKKVVRISVLPGEPTDGSGRACVHLFVRDERGPFVEPHVLQPEKDKDGNQIVGKCVAGPVRGRLACNHSKTVAPVTRGNVVIITLRTDDPRAVSCPKCKASIDYTREMKTSEI